MPPKKKTKPRSKKRPINREDMAMANPGVTAKILGMVGGLGAGIATGDPNRGRAFQREFLSEVRSQDAASIARKRRRKKKK